MKRNKDAATSEFSPGCNLAFLKVEQNIHLEYSESKSASSEDVNITSQHQCAAYGEITLGAPDKATLYEIDFY